MRLALSTLVLAVSGLAATPHAQCFQPDGLSGPCWEQTAADLPDFPDISCPGAAICWDGCNPQPQECLSWVIESPQQIACGRYQANIFLSGCFLPVVLLEGTLNMEYTRTWEEASPFVPGPAYQVWRFAVKVDLKSSATGFSPCAIPSCLPDQETAFYYGYIDYARNCVDGGFEIATVLFHNCDTFIHGPFSSKAGSFHPARSYALVCPSTTDNPFEPAIRFAPSGPIVAEAVRNVPGPFSAACTFEERLNGLAINALVSACACPFSFASPQVTARTLQGVGTCFTLLTGPSSFSSIDTLPVGFPWFHDITTSIGRWSAPTSYPGPEQAWVDEVVLLYEDGCNAAFGIDPSRFVEIHYGGSTSEGFQVISTGAGGLTQNFTDLANNLQIPVGGAIPSVLVGNVMSTEHLIYMNVP